MHPELTLDIALHTIILQLHTFGITQMIIIRDVIYISFNRSLHIYPFFGPHIQISHDQTTHYSREIGEMCGYANQRNLNRQIGRNPSG